jgi:HSP20 family protein
MSEMSRWQRGRNFIDDARREVEDVLRRAFSTYAEGSPAQPPTWSPHVDVAENELGYVVKADLPGIESLDIDVTIHEGVLTIKGERKELRDEKGTKYYKLERAVGPFHRDIALPGAADEERVTATSAGGVITITIPKKPGSVPKKISLQPGS